MTKLTAYESTDKTWNLNFTDSSDTAYDITGATIYFTVKEEKTDAATDIISKSITSHTDAANGESAITLSDTDLDITSKEYYFQIVLEESDGTKTMILDGLLNVKENMRS